MARPSRVHSSKLEAENRRLLKEQEELLGKKEALEEQLRALPAQIKQRRTRERESAKFRAQTAPTISPDGMRGSRGKKFAANRRPLPARELTNSKTKFLVLCIILAALLILLWRSIPV